MGSLCKPGDIIKGLRKGDAFVIDEWLAEGTGWEIYKVTALQTGFHYAMKMSESPENLRAEYEKLKGFSSISQIYKAKITPVAFLFDGCRIEDREYGFYIMNKCSGMQLNKFLGRLKDYEVLYLFNELNNFLSLLEKEGYTFTELRPDYIMFDRQTQRMYMVDFSSLVPMGAKSSNLDDRNSWVFRSRYGKIGMAFPSCSTGRSIGGEVESNFPLKHKGNLNRAVYLIGISSLALFLTSVLYYYL